jgi:hypothetical protein
MFLATAMLFALSYNYVLRHHLYVCTYIDIDILLISIDIFGIYPKIDGQTFSLECSAAYTG